MVFFFPNNVIYIIIQVIKSYGLFSMYNCCFLIILSPFFFIIHLYFTIACTLALKIQLKNPFEG